MDRAAKVQAKSPKPEGLLPKNIQSWLLIGLAFLMISIMWLTGGKKPAAPVKTTPTAAAQAPLEVNETKISELQSRIEDLQRQQLVAQNALAEQTRLIGETTPPPPQPPEARAPSAEPSPDPVEADRKSRAYASLFASNIALSFRSASPFPAAPGAKQAVPVEDHSSADLDSPQAARILEELPTDQPAALPTGPSESGPEKKKDNTESAEGASAHPENSAARTYILLEGTILETVLINRLEGSFAGPVECLLSTDVYSSDRQHLLIPAGAKLLGETRKVDAFGQTRLAVVFHRLLMPDGYSVSLDQFKGLNAAGDTALRDQVNNHYLRIFGVSLAIGALGAVAEAGTGGPLTASGSDLMRQGFAGSTAQSSAQILDKFLNLMPTVTIREGHRVKVYLSSDLALPDYTSHKPSPGL
jgi:type IV secretion system protein TrbI